MLHTFEIPVFEDERSLQQHCLKCGTPSIVYKPRARFYYNAAGKITKNAPQCLEPRILHNFEKIPIPEGEKEVVQTCIDCGKQRVVYASGSRSYFDEKTGARVPYTPPCIKVRDAKVVSIRDFVKATQVDQKGAINKVGKLIEAIFILSSVQRFGTTERTTMMIDSFLTSLEDGFDDIKNQADDYVKLGVDGR